MISCSLKFLHYFKTQGNTSSRLALTESEKARCCEINALESTGAGPGGNVCPLRQRSHMTARSPARRRRHN